LRWKVPRELLWAAIFSLAIFVVFLWPSQYPYSQVPKVDSQNQTESSVSSEHPSGYSLPSQVDHRRENISEITILGIKPGEWLLAIVTWMLWFATVRLVKGADQTSERQLRAYVSVEPTIVYNFGTTANIFVGVDLQNHGETPAGEIFANFWTGLLPNQRATNFVLPQADRLLNMNNSLFPKAKVPVRFPHTALLTATDVADVAAGIQSFHILGLLTYRDSFGSQRTTRISASFGGPDFIQTINNISAGIFSPNGSPTPGWFWSWGAHHNDAT
jgi:hypothetical protein